MYSTIYYIEYFDTENDLIRIDIKKKEFVGTPTLIQGSAVLKYEDRKELTKSIIASTLEIDLEADSNLTLQDLYSEDERTFLVECKKGSDKMLFKGFIKPDGIWEDLVSDSWVISIDCIDGLSTLKDISFADNTGSNFTGDMCIRDVIYNCLIKTGYDLPINYFINVRLMGAYAQNESFLDKVYMSTIRFYQDAGKSKEMDCESVLKSTLAIFGASVFMHNGEWYIIRMPSYVENMTFRRYVNNAFVSELQMPIWSFLGSQINGHYPHFVNANQRKTILPSIQAYRTRLQYGGVRSKVYNSDLLPNSNKTGINGWEINSSYPNVNILPKGGIEADTKNFNDAASTFLIKSIPSMSPSFNKDDTNTLLIKYSNYGQSYGIFFTVLTNNFVLRKNSSGDLYWGGRNSNNDGVSDTSNSDWLNGEGRGDATLTLDIPPFPENSEITVLVYSGFKHWDHSGEPGRVGFYYIGFSNNDRSNQKGVFYTSQRSKMVSTVTKENATVYNGDSVGNIYYCTLVLEDGTPTAESWRRLDKPFKDDGSDLEFRPLVSFIPEDAIRMNHIPMPSLETDILGFIPFLSYVHMRDLIDGSFIFIKYSYDTKTCIIKGEMRRFYYRNFLNANEYRSNKFYETEDDFGDETKVTVKS
ncbi:hypothetical protein CMU30_13810 [Elizabethkingia anophelis]|nr:hypothetical protein [Elizabethkingia anophelis]MDV3684354.1 hypothetical protein [Elizabethkingia anophelis]MDV3699696.1 hypothetical protein [Elizabethkingia anophelis]MDV3763651.1 hypothetical protein [Elizabethkingia anophelis]MDV3802615.1 hypothetical protein [Elizabethkingia anophelis]